MSSQGFLWNVNGHCDHAELAINLLFHLMTIAEQFCLKYSLYNEKFRHSDKTQRSEIPLLKTSSKTILKIAYCICQFDLPVSSSGCNKLTIWGVSLKGINSGTGRNCVAVPNAEPKSIPTHRPSFTDTKMLLKWRSPIPSSQCAMHNTA